MLVYRKGCTDKAKTKPVPLMLSVHFHKMTFWRLCTINGNFLLERCSINVKRLMTALPTQWSTPSSPYMFFWFFLSLCFYTPLKALLECERTDFKMNRVNAAAEQLSVLPCSYLFIVCIMSCAATSCSSSLLKLSSRWFCSCSANCDGGCCCSSSHVQISNKCFALALCCVLSWMFVSSCSWSIWLVCLPFQWLWCQHWLAFALTNHAPPNPSPHPHPSKSWLAVAMTTSCCPALPLPACSACGTLPCPCPVPNGDCPPVRCLWLTVLWGTV